MPRPPKGKKLKDWKSQKTAAPAGKLRIIGGRFRGRQIAYSGDPITRPMKHDIREAVFNLVGGWVPGKAAFDLFAGTGAMGLEAVSRGATRAYLIERHFPTVRIIRENVQILECEDIPIEIAAEDTFFWTRQFLKTPDHWPSEPWVVFCSPPYAFFKSRTQDMLDLISSLFAAAPRNSLFVVESDQRFDPKLLPSPELWRTRQYTPAQISIFRENKGENGPLESPADDESNAVG